MLHAAASNPDPAARVAICDRLLDDGADPKAVMGASGTNVLHILFDAKRHAFKQEARLVARLLDGGADINLVDERKGPPVSVMVNSGMAAKAAAEPVIDAIVTHSTVDLRVPVNRTGRPRRTLGEFIDSSPWKLGLLAERLGVARP